MLAGAVQGQGKKLVVCAQPDAMPRTGKSVEGSAQGLDVAIAELLCKRLGRNLEVHWCASPACSRSCLREGRCDVILGLPHDPDVARDIAWSVPYAGSQFGLVVGKGARDVRSLADLRGKRVGVVVGTVALRADDHVLAQFKTREELLERFHGDKLDAAFVDGDFAAWYLQQQPQLELQLVRDHVPRERWNMALAVRTKSVELLTDVNRALAELAEQGEIRKVYAAHGVVFRPPHTGEARRTPALDTWKRIAARGEMVVSMDPANLPYSSAKDDRPGFDVELARALAQQLGVKLRIDWLDVQRATAVGKLLERESDLALGTPIDPNAVEDDDELAGKVVYSRPYYGTGYLLVSRKDAPRVSALAELKEKSRQLAAEAGSVADYQLRQRGFLRTLYRNQLAVLKGINDGAVDYGYLWANVGWTLHTSPEFALQLMPGYVPEDRWNIAVAMRHGDEELKAQVDRALEKLSQDGTVLRTLARYQMPYFPPYAESSKVDEVIRHPRAERGLEPQMQKVQMSKNPYSGLERVRSAGVLVVGLDQNNLPLSTAHPQPAGLDYEIAGLLARKLGVELKVYWAFAQHDSYPSKLATRKLCDVMLGVTPDARFGQRVLYCRPYYLASYRWVIPAGAGLFSHSGPGAVEQGAVIPSLAKLGESRMRPEVRWYPSVEAILAAVASNEVTTGYVMSTRSQWLAQQRWPGKLAFRDGDMDDRFPICAVVRKTDVDLKDALEAAFADLARSGELQALFQRWHVPYLALADNKRNP